MKEDVELLFSRVKDRLDYIERRIVWVDGNHNDLNDELQEVKEESISINTVMNDLEEQLSQRRQILINALSELESIVNKNGLYIGENWKFSSNEDYLFLED